MSQVFMLVHNISAMFLVICVGWAVRRRGYLGDEASAVLSRLVVDVALPCLIIGQMLRTMSWEAFGQEWPSIVLGATVLVMPYLAVLPFAPLIARSRRSTLLFLVAMPNWVYLPLPIAKALYGDAGERIILLYNAGFQLTLWTLGVWILRGRQTVREALGGLAANGGLWATVVGVALPLLLPGLRPPVTGDPAAESLGPMLLGSLFQTIEMIGSLTVPTSLLAIGVQLGGLNVEGRGAGDEGRGTSAALAGVLTGRLLLGPAATCLAGFLLLQAGVAIPETMRMVGYLIATMPVAISCSVMAQRYGGDTHLAAQGIFWSTFLSLATVPVVFYWIQRLGV